MFIFSVGEYERGPVVVQVAPLSSSINIIGNGLRISHDITKFSEQTRVMIYLEGASRASLYLTNSSDLTISCCLLKPFPEQWLKQDMTGLSHFNFNTCLSGGHEAEGGVLSLHKTQKASIKRIERIWQPYCKWKTVCAFVWYSKLRTWASQKFYWTVPE